MRRLMGLLLLSLAFSACHKSLFSDIPRYMRMQDRYAKYARAGSSATASDSSGQVPARPPVLVATALQFPDSASWRNRADCSDAQIVLLKDGIEVLRVPAGFRAQPDRHRYIRGHLWSDTSDGMQTIVSCDGKEQFRFDGEELLVGFLPMGDQVHTLGQRQGSEGFCYRINGEAVFSSEQGTVLGNPEERAWEGGSLMEESDGIYYVYSVPVRTQQKTDWEYRVMRGGTPVKTILAGTAYRIFDVRFLNGSLYRLEQRARNSVLQVTRDDDPVLLLDMAKSIAASGSLVPGSDGTLLVKGTSQSTQDKHHLAWFLGVDQNQYVLSSPYPLEEWQLEGPTLVGVDSHDGLVGSLWRDGTQDSVLPEGYCLTSPLCMQLQGGNLALALTSAQGNGHLLLLNGEAMLLSFNGYFTSVHIE